MQRLPASVSWIATRGEQDMALLSIRMKQKIGPVGEVLGWIFVLSLVLGPWICVVYWVSPTSFAKAICAVPAIDGPMLNRSLLTPIYPASLSDCLIQTDPLPKFDDIGAVASSDRRL